MGCKWVQWVGLVEWVGRMQIIRWQQVIRRPRVVKSGGYREKCRVHFLQKVATGGSAPFMTFEVAELLCNEHTGVQLRSICKKIGGIWDANRMQVGSTSD